MCNYVYVTASIMPCSGAGGQQTLKYCKCTPY